MEIIFGIIGTIATVIGTYFAWLAIRKDNFKHKEISIGTSNSYKLEKVKKNKKLQVGFFDYPPLIYTKDYDSPPIGVYSKIIQEIANNNQLIVEWNKINLSDAVESIIQDKVDIFVSIFQTPKRNRQTKFVSFLHSIGVSGIVKNEFPNINSIRDLRQRQLKYVVCKDEIGNEIIDEILKVKKENTIIIDTNNISSIASYVQSGFSDMALADSLSCFEFLKNNPDLNLRLIQFNPPMAIYNNGFMIKENDNLFTEWLEKQIENVVNKEKFIIYENKIIQEYKTVINKIR